MQSLLARLSDRINELKWDFDSAPPEALKPYITNHDYQKLLRSVVKFLKNPEGAKLDSVYIKRNTIVLPKGRVLKIPKQVTGTARSMALVHHMDGTYGLIMDAKSKRADGNKNHRFSEWHYGAFKTCKRAFRVDSKTVERWVCLTSKASDEDGIEALNSDQMHREAVISQQLPNSFLKYYHTETLSDKERVRTSLYMPYIKYDLMEYVAKHVRNDLQRFELVIHLLTCVADLHRIGLTHNDIKPTNIRVDGARLWLLDYGSLCSVFELPRPPTVGYEPPEISINAQQHRKEYKSHYDLKGAHSFARQQVEAFNKNNHYAKLLDTVSTPFDEALVTPTPITDAYSCGVVLYQIFYGMEYPDFYNELSMQRINQNPVLQGLLDPYPHKRMSVDEALKILVEQRKDYLSRLENSQKAAEASPSSPTPTPTPITSQYILHKQRLTESASDKREGLGIDIPKVDTNFCVIS